MKIRPMATEFLQLTGAIRNYENAPNMATGNFILIVSITWSVLG